MRLFCKTYGLGIVFSLACGFHASADNIYVSNYGNGTIEKFDSSGNGSIFASSLDNPAGLAFDGSGNLYAAITGDGMIMKFDSSGNESVFASSLNSPSGLAFDGSGDLYVANVGSGTIEKFDPNGIGTVFASGLSFGGGPTYLAFDSSGSLYASTTRTIEKFDSVGNGTPIFSCLNYIYGLAFDSTGNLFASLQNAASITGLRGGGITFGNPFTAAPAGIAFDSSENLYVSLGGMIEKFNSFGGTTQIVPEANGAIFASGLNGANFIVVQPVPEPEIWTMAVTGLGLMLLGRRFRQRHSSFTAI